MVYFMYIVYLHLKRKYPCDILRRQNLKRVCHFLPRNIWHIKRRMIVHPGVLTVGIWIKCRWLNHVWTNPFLSNNSHGSYRYQYRFRRVSKHHETAAYRRGHQKQGIKLLPVRLHRILLGSYHSKNLLNFSTQKNDTKWITAPPVLGWKDKGETTN